MYRFTGNLAEPRHHFRRTGWSSPREQASDWLPVAEFRPPINAVRSRCVAFASFIGSVPPWSGCPNRDWARIILATQMRYEKPRAGDSGVLACQIPARHGVGEEFQFFAHEHWTDHPRWRLTSQVPGRVLRRCRGITHFRTAPRCHCIASRPASGEVPMICTSRTETGLDPLVAC